MRRAVPHLATQVASSSGTEGSASSRLVLIVGLGALFVGASVLVAFALDAMTRSHSPGERMLRRLSLYTITGRLPKARAAEPSLLRVDSGVARSAVEFADKVMERQGLNTAVDSRLEAAGLPLRPAEWMLLHIGAAVATATIFLLLSRGSLIATVLGLFLGLSAPCLFLTLRTDRREAKFLSQLPDTLQLLAGGLQAGYSLPQALDTVVRESDPPISTEFNRALVESRLGLPVEEALEGIAGRLSSRDFSWVVMAVRIQRDVGGNLAELLTTIAGTLRERERQRRQVRALSAEGRLSGWILGALPVVFAAYLAVVQPAYLRPLTATPIGWAMLLTAALLLVVGAFWISKVVRVDV